MSNSQTVFSSSEPLSRLFLPLGTRLLDYFIESTHQACRLLKHALELKKPVLMLNVGPTRADTLDPPVEKIEIPSGDVLREVVRALVLVSCL